MSVGEDEAEQFSLRWNNFHNNLTHGFHELLEEEDLVDVTLACDGKYVQAHKIVLSVCSPYFKSLFRDNPCRHPIVILKDVGHKELQAILQFMYRGEVNVRQDDLTGFLKTAEMLKIKGLTGENNDKDSQKRALSEEKRRPRGVPSHCDDDSSPVPYKRIKPEQRRSRVIARPSSRPHSPVECIPPSSVNREELLHSEFDVTKPKEEPVDYSQVEDEYSSELAPSLPHEIEEGMEEVEEEATGEEVSEGRQRGSGRNHVPSEAQGSGGEQPPSALAAMAHLVHVGGPSGSDGQRQDSRGLESKQLPSLALPPLSGAVMEPNVTLQMESKERLQGTGMFPGSSGLSQDSSSSQDISQGFYGLNCGIIPSKIHQIPENLKRMPTFITETAITCSPSTSAGISSPEVDQHQLLKMGNGNKKLKCPHCLSVFSNNGNLKVHIEDQHLSRSQYWHCLQCDVTYKNRSSLRTHLWRAHQRKLCDNVQSEAPNPKNEAFC